MTPTAPEIRDAVDRWRTWLWPKFQKERALDLYFNGESLPGDGQVDPPPTLGIGRKFVNKPHKHLMSFFDDAPGPFDAEVHDPLVPQLSQKLGRALDAEVNAIAKDRFQSVLRSIGGRYLVTGRAFGYRPSKRDLYYRPGRLLAPHDAPDDVLSDEFWEWAFLGRMQLGELDAILKSKSTGAGGQGWNRQGIEALKQWIIKSPPDRDQGAIQQRDMPNSIDEPFNHRLSRQPLDVYYYFRKCEERYGRFRKIDFYVVSRWNENAHPVTQLNPRTGTTERKLEIKLKGDAKEDENQVLFSQQYAFDSVYQCLIPFIGDSRISGDQEMHQVKGEGELVFARLLLQEHMTHAVAEGVSFGVQPNFSLDNRADAAWARKIAEEGLSPWDEVPKGLRLLEKNNAFSGLNAAMEFLNSLGFSTSQDAATGDLGNSFGQQLPTNFKGESQMMLAQIQQDVSQRNARWFSACDLLFSQVGETLLQRPGLWRRHDPGYHDAQEFHRRMSIQGFMPADYDPERVRLIARRTGDKQSAIQKAQAILADPNSPPKVRMWAYKQLLAALYNDSVAEDLLPDEPEQPDMNQAQSAILQNSAALASLLPMPPLPGDDPAVHIEQFHRPALVQRVQLLAQQGWMSPIDQQGIGALIQHMMMDAQNLPMDLAQIYIQELQGVAQLIQKQIPVQAKGSELDLQRRDADRKDMVAQATVAERQSLIESRGAAQQQKTADQQFKQQAQLAQLADQEIRTNLEVQRTQQEAINEVLTTQPPA